MEYSHFCLNLLVKRTTKVRKKTHPYVVPFANCSTSLRPFDVQFVESTDAYRLLLWLSTMVGKGYAQLKQLTHAGQVGTNWHWPGFHYRRSLGEASHI